MESASGAAETEAARKQRARDFREVMAIGCEGKGGGFHEDLKTKIEFPGGW
jgi:hypothetical protein